ncbi:MAG: GNAT family N-acetyltransferase [Bacteroidota bacterium]
MKTPLARSPYLFESERLGFRNWSWDDRPEFAALNADEKVMAHFPQTLSEQQTVQFIERLQRHYQTWGYNYFATEIRATGEWIGFIGLARQEYESAYTPATDIGWRLKTAAWGKGYATEGARRCLEYAFDELQLSRIIATCTERNTKSERVMQNIGMTRLGTFKHPRLRDFPDYERCICYEIRKR